MIETVAMYQARCDWPDCDAIMDEDDSLFMDEEDLWERFGENGWLIGLNGQMYCDRHPTQEAANGYWSATDLDPMNQRLLGPGPAPSGFEPSDEPVLLIDLDGIAVYTERVT